MRVFLLMCCFILFSKNLKSQCPGNRDSTWKQLLFIYDDKTRTEPEKIATFTSYSKVMEKCPGSNDSTHAFLLQLIAEKYYQAADFLNAVTYYRKSSDLIVANATNPAINRKRLIGIYYWQSVMYDSLNNIPEKIKAVNRCIDMAVEFNATKNFSYIRCLYQRTKYYFDIGDYRQCINDARMCEELASAYIKTVAKNSREYIAGKSIATSSLGWYVEAQVMLKDFTAAEQYLDKKSDEYKKAGPDNNLADIYSQKAEVEIYKGDYQQALSLYNAGLQYAYKAGRNYSCKQILNKIGNDIYYKHFADYRNALLSFRKALGFVNSHNELDRDDIMESLSILTNMANVYVQQGNYDSAFRYFQLAFDQLKPGTNETGILNAAGEELWKHPKVYYLEQLLLDKAFAFQKKYAATGNQAHIREAVHIYKLADRLLDRIRSVQTETESKLFWRQDTHRLYEQAVSACYQLADAADAFYFFEKSRAVLLNDQLAQQPWMDADVIFSRVQVNKKIARLQRILDTLTETSPPAAALRTELFAARQQQENLAEEIRKRNPLYYQNMDTAFISLAEVQSVLLKEHNGLLELFSGDSAAYSIIITRERVDFFKINLADFQATTHLYKTYLADFEIMNKDFESFKKISNHLYTLIFPNNRIPAGRIIISPDGPLFPFEPLITNNDTGEPVYFLKDHAVSYTYSARYLLNNFLSHTGTASGDLLGIAPVQYANSLRLNPLTGSDQSLKKIGSCIRYSKELIHQQATRNSFLQQFPGYKIIQLYTHAADSSDRKEPVIYFADSLLYLSELLPDKIPVTQLIVLSACETGSGKLYQGEGVFSFSRGFAVLGIPSSISNLWSVDNLATYQLTEYFYKYLSEGSPIDVALQKAKLEFLEKATGQYTLPYYWSPAVLIGKTTAIEYKRSFPWLITGLSILLLIVIVLLLIKYRKIKASRSVKSNATGRS